MSRDAILFPGPALFVDEQPIRIGDINYGNHLGHDSLVTILHEARARFFRANEMDEADVDGRGIVIAELLVSYRAQAFYGQVLKIEIAAREAGSRGCDLYYRATDRNAGTLIALARTSLLFFDYGAQRVASMPERFRRAITRPHDS